MMNLKSGTPTKLINTDTIISRKKNKKEYYRNINTFDIEVTNYEKSSEERYGIPYLWIFCIDEDNVYFGRTMEEFRGWLEAYGDILEANNPDATQVIYIHNLAYEFQFIRYFFDWDDVFLIDTRRPLVLRYRMFEIRCSYLLSNMSLAAFLKKYDVEAQKLEFNYTKQRFPWDPLSKLEIQYCYNDTVGLYQAINRVFEMDGRNVTDIPLTSTAYVRQDVKRSQNYITREKIKELSRIDSGLYRALKGAFVGGNTHASRFYAGEIIENVTCYDITSSYPFVQVTGRYPITPFREKKDLDHLKLDKNFAYLLFCEFSDISLCDQWDGMPTISTSKCIDKKNTEIDNGRILSADFISLWLTDIELSIIKNHYDFKNLTIKKCYFSRYGSLPDCIKSVIYKYFEDKCTLKNVNPYLYGKSKNKLNSIFGMSAFDVGKKRVTYKDADYKRDTRPIDDILSEYFNSTTPAEPYAWGVWTTAQARKNLDDLIRLAGDRFIYCDTDSIYVYGNLDEEIKLLNEDIKKQSEAYSVTFNGKKYYLGIWNKDKECKFFKTLGAKKYCYVDESGTHTVTAGVSKEAGVKDIEEYETGHVFKNATSSAWYTDEPVTFMIGNHKVNLLSSLYIKDSDYTLGITDLYNALLFQVCGDCLQTF